jgi:tetratricopeptide (TPR) repeat protein
MATKQKQNKNTSKPNNDILENPEALAEQLSRSEEFLNKNKNLVIAVVVGIAVLISGLLGYNYYMDNQNNLAQAEMFNAVFEFDNEEYEKALGDGFSYGFLYIIDEYKGTKAANLASYYAGVIYLQQGEFEKSIENLKKFSADDIAVNARALSLIGDAYMELGNNTEAASYYTKAAGFNPNKFFTPTYLMKAALAYEKLGENKKAIASYDKIIKEYSTAPDYNKARKYKARLEGLASN